MTNRLAGETSPYLLQHAENPVDWYPWGDEAFAEAARRGVPILLSVGYAACHWCHVMERESFEDERIARLMNDNFVNVKVDREERPDIDAVYMDAVQAMTGQGGWPMTVFLTPAGEPFYGGTYFPPEERYGMPSFAGLLDAIADAWRHRRVEVEEQGRKLVGHLDPLRGLRASREPITAAILENAWGSMRGSFDPEWGGFGNAPKFPQPMTVDLMLKLARRNMPDAAACAKRTLDAMAAGGMFDQIGGGFARYSVDRYWLVPHFEKMLYDNAQLLRTYARSYLSTGSERHAEVARMTGAWMLREMRDPAGGFWSSLDADSEGEEGRFYLWSVDEVRALLGDRHSIAATLWGFTDSGNFEGRNIPVYASTPDDPDVALELRGRLLHAREERVRPATDDKVLSAWNGLAVAALAEAGVALSVPAWIEAAKEAMSFVLDTLRVDGRLMRSYRDGVVKHLAFAEDHAAVLEGCLALYEATSEPAWLAEATWAADEAIRLFHDPEAGGFFTSGSDAERLITRAKELTDNAVPSANSVMAHELQRLALITGRSEYETIALGTLRLVADIAQRSPLGFARALEAVDFYTGDPLEIVIVGEPGADRDRMVRAVHERWLPNKVLVVADESHPEIPLLAGRRGAEVTTAYVCRRGVCRVPATSYEALDQQLAA